MNIDNLDQIPTDFSFYSPYPPPRQSTTNIVHKIYSNGMLHIELNRARALHSLTYEMVFEITKLLHFASMTDSIAFIVFTAGDIISNPNSSKSSKSSTKKHIFSVGGDIKELSSIISGESKLTPMDFVGSEYAMNQMLTRLNKPTISISDGLAMGGGAGLEFNCQFKIVTENAQVAMPECKIGWIPDVGCTYWMNPLVKLGKQIPLFLGLTGMRIPSHFLATHFCQSIHYNSLLKLLKTTNSPFKPFTRLTMTKILSKSLLSELPLPHITEKYPFPVSIPNINSIFSSFNIYTIYKTLQGSKNSQNTAIYKQIFHKTKSPLSIVLTTKAFELAANKNWLGLESCLETEYQINMNLSKQVRGKNNFVSGTISLLVKRDGNPDWLFKSIWDISKSDLEQFGAFSPSNSISFFLNGNDI